MSWQIASALNAVIAGAYLVISVTVVRGLLTTGQLRSNPLAVATAGIFFTCAVHHGSHTVHMLLPVFGAPDAHGLAMREAFGWQMAAWDAVGAAVAVYYVSLRRTYGTLLQTPSMFEDAVRRRIEEETERERSLLAQAEELAHVGSWEADLAAGVITWSPGFAQIRGGPMDAPITADAVILDVHPEDRARVAEEMSPQRAVDGELSSNYRFVREDGAVRHVETRARVTYDEEGTPVRITGVSMDVTERRLGDLARERAESEVRERQRMLAEAEERFRQAFENAPIGMALVELDGRITQANDALCEITGRRRAELLAAPLPSLAHAGDAALDLDASRRTLGAGAHVVSEERRFLRPDGTAVWVQLQMSPLRDGDGAPLRFIAQIQDISGRRDFEQQLRHMADHDPLTGLLNRRTFEDELRRRLSRQRRQSDDHALLFIDLDDFKYVNDSLGHAAGDRLIVSVADALRESLRDDDVVARLGGDEFAVLLPHTDAAQASAVAEKLLGAIRGLRPAQDLVVTASIGIATLGEGLADADDVLVAGDLAMYDAKEAGKNRALRSDADAGHEPRMKRRMAWLDQIRGALRDDGRGLVLHAQPVVELATGAVIKHELLVRMVGADGDLIPPAAFLDIAERFDLVQELDRIVTRRAIAHLASRPGDTGAVAVNLSGRSIGDPSLPVLVESLLAEAGVDPARLCFEITETAAVSNLRVARQFAERLAATGCRLALDDFGAGFGSFYYLKHLPFDYVKIDGEFIADCTTNHTSRLVIDALVALTRGMGKHAVAEFVTDAATARFLRERGVHYGQGFHLGRPVPLETISDGVPDPA